MPFHSDKQRKGFFAQKGNIRSNVNPSISGKITNIKEKLQLRKERIEKEQEEKSQRELKKLTIEAEIESKREQINLKKVQRKQQLKQEISELKKEKFKRSFAGKVQQSFKEKQRKRREFLKTPEGKALIKRQEQKKEQLRKSVRKGAVATRKLLFG